MSLQIAKKELRFPKTSRVMSGAQHQDKNIKVLIPYDGSESAETALDDLRSAGLPLLDAMIAVTKVLLPLSPHEISRAVSARRMKVLTAGASSFAPALRDHEEQRVLSREAERRVSSVFPLSKVTAEALPDTVPPANEILRKAKQWGAELIVLGSNISPSSQITDYAGAALKVAREADCSVRIARASHRNDGSPLRIIVVLDGSAAVAARVIAAVADRIWPAESEIRLVAVRNGPSDSRRDSETKVTLDWAAQTLRANGLTVSIAIRDGTPHDVPLYEAREFAANCIFIDSRGLSHQLEEGHGQRGLSKAAEAVVLGAHCSVEVVRAPNFGGPYPKTAA